MMTKAEISALKSWFSRYCQSFFTHNVEEQRNFSLKEHHTHNVCQNILIIAKDENLSPEQQDLAEVVALFHDVGRFVQYSTYKTFKDSESANHAALGADVLTEKDVLSAFPREERDLIIKCVRFHNVFALPSQLSPEENLYLRLIRDADKLDIWRVFIEYFNLPEKERASAAGLGFPDLPYYSEEVMSCLENGHMIQLSMLNTLNDFKLLQLSWVFDLNFAASFRLLRERNYIDDLGGTLVRDHRGLKAIGTLKAFASGKEAAAGSGKFPGK